MSVETIRDIPVIVEHRKGCSEPMDFEYTSVSMLLKIKSVFNLVAECPINIGTNFQDIRVDQSKHFLLYTFLCRTA